MSAASIKKIPRNIPVRNPFPKMQCVAVDRYSALPRCVALPRRQFTTDIWCAATEEYSRVLMSLPRTLKSVFAFCSVITASTHPLFAARCGDWWASLTAPISGPYGLKDIMIPRWSLKLPCALASNAINSGLLRGGACRPRVGFGTWVTRQCHGDHLCRRCEGL